MATQFEGNRITLSQSEKMDRIFSILEKLSHDPDPEKKKITAYRLSREVGVKTREVAHLVHKMKPIMEKNELTIGNNRDRKGYFLAVKAEERVFVEAITIQSVVSRLKRANSIHGSIDPKDISDPDAMQLYGRSVALQAMGNGYISLAENIGGLSSKKTIDKISQAALAASSPLDREEAPQPDRSWKMPKVETEPVPNVVPVNLNGMYKS